MEQMDTFHKTVRGHLHIMRNLPCEDSSASFSKNGNYYIAVVADGHGSEQCFRSSFGAKIAVNIALTCLQEFAETILALPEMENQFYKDIFTNPRYRNMTLRQLTDTIIARWNDGILEHYKKNPLTKEEKEKEVDSKKETIAYIYGTTLLAALMLPSCLILLHQGDGRCDVFYEDGTIDQPIPWDSRCEDTITTSLCDEDAADSIRTCVLNIEEKKVIACYLGCDGVEDAYRDTYEGLGGSHILMGGVHTFYKDLTCQLAIRNKTEFETYLDTMLPKFSEHGMFSRSGSGDDVSIAGIVNKKEVQKFIDSFQVDVKQYALEEELFWKEDELRGKTRKHGILLKREKEAQELWEKAKEAQDLLEVQLEQLQKDYKELEEQTIQAKEELEEYHKDSKDLMEYFNETKEETLEDGEKLIYKLRKFGEFGVQTIKHFCDEVSIRCQIKEREYKRLCKKLQDHENEILIIEEKYRNYKKNTEMLEDNFKNASKAFADYDKKYQTIYKEKTHILDEIAALQK